MIYVSFGNPYEDFSRLAIAVDRFASTTDEEIIVQSGYTNYEFKHAKFFAFCTKQEMLNYFQNARILILQGGWGSISEAIELGKKIIAVPRIMNVEHIHDQEQLVRKLESQGCVLGIYDLATLPEKIKLAETHHFSPIPRGSATALISAKLNEWFGKS